MTDILNALLEQIEDPAVRAAISAGWELGSDIPTSKLDNDYKLKKEIHSAAEALSRKMGLNADIVSGAALLSMALSKRSRLA